MTTAFPTEKGTVGNMNAVANHYGIPYSGYGYPIAVTEIPDYGLFPRGNQHLFFDSGRFAKGSPFGRLSFDDEPESELYTAEKKVRPNRMQFIGTLIDLYA